MAKNFVKAIDIAAIDAADLDANFFSFDDNGLPEACFKIRIVNNSNIDVFVSYDEENAHDIVASNTQATLDFQLDASPNGYVCLIRKGTIISVASLTGLAGNGDIYLIGYYQEV